MADVTRLIKQRAGELGFQKVGICPAQAPRHLPLLADWLDRGHHGTMQWMERTREKRLDIDKVLPEVRSVVVVGLNYFSEGPNATSGFRISRYAHGADYHPIIEKRLQSLAAYLTELQPGASVLSYCDTGPVAEKIWAEAAGIGWQGKHSNLISKEYSSWLFLGILLTDALLEYDQPATNHCGSCTRCIEACPTRAITEPYVVDSRRCISYLTIEHRGITPESLRSGIGNWIYGCDICQEVCPWNATPARSRRPEWQPRPGLDRPRLVDLWRTTDGELGSLVRGTPLTRPGLKGLRRNVAVAIGNSGSRDAADVLASEPPAGVTSDAPSRYDSLVREHARWAVDRLRRMRTDGG